MGRSSPGTYSHTSSLQPPIKLHVLKLHGHNKMELEILPRVRVATRDDDDDDDVGTLNQSGTSLFILVAVAPESESNTLSLYTISTSDTTERWWWSGTNSCGTTFQCIFLLLSFTSEQSCPCVTDSRIWNHKILLIPPSLASTVNSIPQKPRVPTDLQISINP